MGEIQNLCKQIDFNNLTYYFKNYRDPKKFIVFKGILGFYRNINDGYTTLEKAEESKKKLKSDLNEIVKGKWEYTSEEQKNAIKILKVFKSHESYEMF